MQDAGEGRVRREGRGQRHGGERFLRGRNERGRGGGEWGSGGYQATNESILETTRLHQGISKSTTIWCQLYILLSVMQVCSLH